MSGSCWGSWGSFRSAGSSAYLSDGNALPVLAWVCAFVVDDLLVDEVLPLVDCVLALVNGVVPGAGRGLKYRNGVMKRCFFLEKITF